MQLEDFLLHEVNRLVKFMVWWGYSSTQDPDGFPVEMDSVDWVEQLAMFDPDSEACQVPSSYQFEEHELDAIRSDLLFQLKTPDDLDWNYFLETAIRAKLKADATGTNMTLDKQ